MSMSPEKVLAASFLLFSSSTGLFTWSNIDRDMAVQSGNEGLNNLAQKCFNPKTNLSELTSTEGEFCHRLEGAHIGEDVNMDDLAPRLVDPNILKRVSRDENIMNKIRLVVIIAAGIGGASGYAVYDKLKTLKEEEELGFREDPVDIRGGEVADGQGN